MAQARRTMNGFHRSGWHGVLLLSAALAGGAVGPARAQDRQPVHLDVLLPEDAELVVDGHRTKSTGETRRFESPPVETGRAYAYTVKVSWRGQELTRRVRVRPGGVTTLDLREERQKRAARKPEGSFALLAPALPPGLEAGGKADLRLRLRRRDFDGPVRVAFEALPRGVTAAGLEFGEGRSEGSATLTAAADAPEGVHEIRAVADGGQGPKVVVPIKVTVTRRPAEVKPAPKKEPEVRVEQKPAPKPEKAAPRQAEEKPAVKPAGPKPEPRPEQAAPRPAEPKPAAETGRKPAAGPALELVLPAEVELPAGRTRFVEVRVRTADASPLPQAPTVALAADGRLRAAPWTSSFRAGQPACTVGLALTAEPGAPAGRREVRVRAAAGKCTAEGTLRVTVKPAVPEPSEP